MRRYGIIIALFIICHNSYGQTFEWVSKIGGPQMDLGMSTAIDPAGNVYVTGYFQDTCDVDPGPLVNNMVSQGLNDIFILKLDALGNLIWARSIGGNLDDYSFSMSLDNTGNIYISGMFKDSVDFDPGPGTHFLTSAGDYDIFIIKWILILALANIT